MRINKQGFDGWLSASQIGWEETEVDTSSLDLVCVNPMFALESGTRPRRKYVVLAAFLFSTAATPSSSRG